jgi:hypothetical protein
VTDEALSPTSSVFLFFTPHQRHTIAAATARLFPSDALGPGAPEAGVVVYIDRALAGHDAHLRAAYHSGVAWLDREAAARGGDAFWRCAEAIQDEVLRAVEEACRVMPRPAFGQPFFDALLAHTYEGMFADPLHGGNKDMAGWKLLGYPGAHLDFSADDVLLGNPIVKPAMCSLADLGRERGMRSGDA